MKAQNAKGYKKEKQGRRQDGEISVGRERTNKIKKVVTKIAYDVKTAT